MTHPGEDASPDDERWVDERGCTYRVVDELGRGVLTQVCAGESADGHKVALKTVLPLWIGHPLAEERIAREREISAAIHEVDIHPCCAHVVAGGRQTLSGGRSRPFHVSPLLEGETLATRTTDDDERSRSGRALAYVDELLGALDRLHGLGWIHRDVKPQNVFVVASGEHAMLLDFGLAVRIGTRRIDGDEPFGTPAYVSPEVVAGALLDARSDLYSVGLLLFELVCRRRPFTARDPIALLDAHLSETPPPVRALCPSLSTSLEDAIACALQKPPGDRPASARALRERLRATPEFAHRGAHPA